MIADTFKAVFVLLTLLIYRETYVERRKEESSNDRNDRAIRTAARWVVQQLAEKESFYLRKETSMLELQKVMPALLNTSFLCLT